MRDFYWRKFGTGYSKDCEMVSGANLTIGILFCSEKTEKMLEYVLNGMGEKIFISTYMRYLPDKK